MIVRDATPEDAAAIAGIYNHVIDESDAIWLDDHVTTDDRRRWLEAQAADDLPVLVAEADGTVVGYAAYFPFRAKSGYRLTVEHTILLGPGQRGAGTGQVLLDALTGRARAAGLAVMVAGCDGGNAGAIAFHERNGFRRVGAMPGVGRKHDRPVDLILLQRDLEEDR